MAYFRNTRNIELSTLKYISDNITSDWSGVTLVKAFLDAYQQEVPVVCVRLAETASNRREIGSTAFLNRHTIIIDVFAKSDGQRLDLADYLLNLIKDNWILYDITHTSGNPEALTYTDSGKKVVLVRVTQNTKIEFRGKVEKQDRFRHTLAFQVSDTQ